MADGRVPDPDEFVNTQCNDIAAGGFSFLCEKPPAADVFVVALGMPPRITYLMAQIRHVTRIEQDGRPVFVVGCKYTDRVDY